MSKIFAIIPARYDSSRFPGKVLALICGKPMIQHVYERASLCSQLDYICVATDSEKIFSCVKGLGGRAIITKRNHKSGTDRVYEAAKKLGLSPEDVVINIQGDQPAFHPSIISLLVEPLLKDSSIFMTTLKYPIDDKDALNPNHVKVVTDNKGFALYFSRAPIPYFREKENITYYKHLGFYGYRMSALEIFTQLPEGRLERIERLEQLRALENGYKIKVLESPYNSIEVDVPEDIKKVEEFISSQEI